MDAKHKFYAAKIRRWGNLAAVQRSIGTRCSPEATITQQSNLRSGGRDRQTSDTTQRCGLHQRTSLLRWNVISVRKSDPTTTNTSQPHIFTSLSKPKFYELASSKALKLTGFCQDTTERVDAETYGKTSCEALVEWTKHGQIKVYPANFQVLSGHFDPRDPWFCGVQYSCLNFQNMDMNTIINYGMFNRNGNCGYLLKPDFLRPGCGLFFNPLKLTLTSKTTGEKEKLPKDKVRIQILAAMQLPRIEKRFVKYDPYVRVFVLDRFGKSNCNSYKTLVVSNNAFNPAWNNLISFEIVASELALILFQVLDSNIKKDDVIASNCIPYTCMRTGHVHIPLYDESLKLLPNSCLFSKIQISSKGTGRRPSFKQEESELG